MTGKGGSAGLVRFRRLLRVMVAKWLLAIGTFAGLAAAPIARSHAFSPFGSTAARRLPMKCSVGDAANRNRRWPADHCTVPRTRSVHSLIRRTFVRHLPRRHVEFRGGDRLPGRVVKFAAADEKTGVPAHLVVESDGDLGFPNVFARSQVRVDPDWVRRIVDRPPTDANVPAQGLRLRAAPAWRFRSCAGAVKGCKCSAIRG